MDEDTLRMNTLKMGLESEDTGQLPSYTNHKDFGKLVFSSRANMCYICSKGIINYINPVGAQLLQGKDAYEFIGQELAGLVNLSFGEMIALRLRISSLKKKRAFP